jgi:hypothetical protein
MADSSDEESTQKRCIAADSDNWIIAPSDDQEVEDVNG